jgi:hypothetical protein
MDNRFLLRAATFIAVATTLLACRVEAQFGKLKKAATDQAASAAGVPTSPPRYVQNIDVTAAQVDQINKGLDAELAAAPQAMKTAEEQSKNIEKAQQQYEKDRTAYEKASTAYDSCKEKVITANKAGHDSLAKKTESAANNAAPTMSDQEAMQAQAEKAKAAAQRIQAGTGTAADQQTIADFQKMAAAMSSKGMQAAAVGQQAASYDQATIDKINKTCGTQPVAPTAPSSTGTTAADVIRQAGASAAGVSMASYPALREKVIGYAQSNTQVKGGSIPEADANAINTALGQTRTKVTQMQKAGVPI